MELGKADSALSPEAKKAVEYMNEAEQALKRFSWFSSTSTKYEDAAGLYLKAANNFKVAQKWQEAGDAFVKCADIEVRLSNQYESATHLIMAAECLKRIDPALSISHYRHGISTFSELGRFGTAAKHTEALAQMYEDDNNLEEAVNLWRKAADLYEGDNSTARAGKCLEKVALINGTLGKYPEAIATFEKLGTQSLESNLLKFNAKKHFLHAGLCFLARGDFVGGKEALQRYSTLDFTFEESREKKLLDQLIEACEQFDVDKFADQLYSYDSISRLDPWQTSLLLKIKTSIQESGDDIPDLQ